MYWPYCIRPIQFNILIQNTEKYRILCSKKLKLCKIILKFIYRCIEHFYLQCDHILECNVFPQADSLSNCKFVSGNILRISLIIVSLQEVHSRTIFCLLAFEVPRAIFFIITCTIVVSHCYHLFQYPTGLGARLGCPRSGHRRTDHRFDLGIG